MYTRCTSRGRMSRVGLRLARGYTTEATGRLRGGVPAVGTDDILPGWPADGPAIMATLVLAAGAGPDLGNAP